MGRHGRVIVDDSGPDILLRAGVAPTRPEPVRRHPAADVADDAGDEHDERERQVQREDGHESAGRNCPQPGVLQGARTDPVSRMYHQRGHRGLDAVEEAGHDRHIAEGHVDPRQRNQDEQRRQHEQSAGDDATPRTVHEPADVGSQLLGLRPWQHHAVVQRMEETVLRDPAAPLDQFLMHEGDLSRRTTEADETEPQPVAECVGAGRRGRCLHAAITVHGAPAARHTGRRRREWRRQAAGRHPGAWPAGRGPAVRHPAPRRRGYRRCPSRERALPGA